jgi:1-acyl-sn-glycerol-3-phosphate acyltransferase
MSDDPAATAPSRFSVPSTSGELASWPLPHQSTVNGWVVRLMAFLACQRLLAIRGLEHVQPARDPFILALNHSTMLEALLVPALLIRHRGGRLIHFLADWNYRLIPGIGLIYRGAQTITVTRKPARPRVLNVLKPLFLQPETVLARTLAHLERKQAVGIFVEGRVNRDPLRLLPARRSAALLSLRTGVPVVPVGIRFPRAQPDRPISDLASMEVHIGAPLHPPARQGRVLPDDLGAWHAVIMREISSLCGKAWTPQWWSRHR